MNDFIGVRSKKKLGQVFLVNEKVAEAEAAHCYGKVVLEVGPGLGMLTRALCSNAKKVIAVEKDYALYMTLKHEIGVKNIHLINKDFMKTTDDEIGLKEIDILISNIPYNLSSSIIEWLAQKKMQAVLCLQKEFVDHMLAKPDTRNYSKLSVITSLQFRVTKIMNVPKGNFRPIPKVDSVVIYLKPIGDALRKRDAELIGLLMLHKKKTLRNAIVDSHAHLSMSKDELRAIAQKVPQNGRRVFKLTPAEILGTAQLLDTLLK